MSLRNKLLTTIITLILIANTVAYLGIEYYFTRFISERYGNVNLKNTEMAASHIERILDSYEHRTNELYQAISPFFINDLSIFRRQMADYFIKAFEDDSLISGVRMKSSNGILFEYYSRPWNKNHQLLLDNYPRSETSFFSAPKISEVTSDTIVSHSVFVESGYEQNTRFTVDYKVTELFRILEQYRGFGTTDEAYLVDYEGLLISPSRFVKDSFHKQKTIARPHEGSVSVEGRSYKSVKYKNYLGTEVLSNYIPISRLRAILHHEISIEEAYKPVSFIRTMLFWGFALVFLAVLIGSIIVSRRITRPLKILQKNVKKIEKGDLNFKIEVNGSDEIGELAIGFERMRNRIRESEQELKKYSESLESEVKRRTAQIYEKVELLEVQRSETLNMAKQMEEINKVLHEEINEREKVEHALKESEMRYKIVSDISSDYAYALGVQEDGSIKNLWMTGAFERMTGYTREEISERGGWEFLIHPEDTAIALQQVGVYLSGMPSVSEYRIRSKAGEVRWVLDKGRPEWDADERRVKYIYGAIKDITAEKAAEKEVKNSERSYRELFDNNTDAIYILGPDIKFITVNSGAAEMYGYPKEQFIGKTIEFISAYGLNDLKKINGFIKLAFEGKAQRFEFWGKQSDGSVFPIEIHLFSGTYFGKEVIIAYAQDISERKNSEKQLQQLSQSIEQSPISVMITDADSRIEYANKYFMEISGFNEEDLQSKLLSDLRANEVPESVFNDIWSIIKSGHVWRGELLSKKKDGTEYWEDATVSPIQDQSGHISNFIVFKKDITENKKLEEQFRQSQKMEAIGRLAGGVAHDFNNLLTVIIGYSELILGQIAEEDALFNKIKQIDKAGRRAEALTRQLLAFSRKQIMQPKTINLNQMIHDMEKMLYRLIGEHIELQTVLNDEIGNLKADPGQIEQVIMNLSVNARDAMQDGGKLLIETDVVQYEKAVIIDNQEIDVGNYISLTISDTGIGISERLKSQIFEPFFTTKEKGKGTGLGLSTVYGIVTQSKGFISVDSEEGKGTTFRILFPKSSYGSESELDTDVNAADLKGTETVLVVEDEEALRELTVETLEGANYNVLQAEDGEVALRTCINYNEKIHLIITDVVMPKMNGRKLVENVMKIHPEMLVLYISGYTDDAIIHHGVLEQNTEFLAKPFQPTALLYKIRKILDQNSSI